MRGQLGDNSLKISNKDAGWDTKKMQMQMITNANDVWFISILMVAFKTALTSSLHKNGL